MRPQALSGNFPHGNMGGISTEMVANLSGEPQSRGLRRSFLPMVISEEFLSSSRGGVCKIQEAPSAALNLRESHGPSPHGSRGGREESRNLLGHRRKRSETSDASSEDFSADATPPGGIPEITWTEQFNGPAPSELRSFLQRQARNAMLLDLHFPVGGDLAPPPLLIEDRVFDTRGEGGSEPSSPLFLRAPGGDGQEPPPPPPPLHPGLGEGRQPVFAERPSAQILPVPPPPPYFDAESSVDDNQ